MSSWEGFVGRLRNHAYSVKDPTTRGYLNVAADRIEELEDKLLAAQNRANFLDHQVFQLRNPKG